MAKVTITFEDQENGKVNTTVEFAPAVEAGEIPTNAQALGLSMLNKIREVADEPA